MNLESHAVSGIAEIIGLTPLERPDAGLVAALCDAGALGVLDLGHDPIAASRALAVLARRVTRGFGVRIPETIAIDANALPEQVSIVITADPAHVARFAPRRVLVQVTSLDEARAAIAAGAAGLIAKGSEAGGRIADETTFVLLQHLLAEVTTPVWAQGGIGHYTAAACIAGGAAGIVLDSQLALVRESSLPAEIQAAIGAMDGSETTVIAGHRVYTRPDLPVAHWGGLDVAGVRARLGGDDLAKNLLPLGQEAAFAKSLARRMPTAAQLVRGIRASIGNHLAMAVEHQPLASNGPFATSHGIRYPIAQGPMSRVSDRARFAEAVAASGGLPFLALTLMSGAEVRELLRETAALVGDRPWGVGILGFVPQEIREQQLAVIKEFAPPVALIAGGRPSQATPLEAQGTATYLHVPSPGLLELFLRDGARRFVFEGRECGGHVGPRSSFALWEQQLEILLAHENASELHVLFAGGIHDGRSAAMVAAMAAPLAAKGAKLGMLMGTAYLFTHEAVACGAIEPGFQEAAIACERTVLLETAPGHSTRCADSEYAGAFAVEKKRLEATGASPQETWAALEQLNLGRLRIAAKGLKRDGDVIAPVDAELQQREGMYMIGQVAALRRATCSVLELHRAVTHGGVDMINEAAERHEERDEGYGHRGTDIAVIGLAAIFPGAPDTDAFWTNIVTGKNSIREVPPDRWSAETYYDPAATGADAGRKTPCKWGGFIDDVPFDPLAYGIPPKSLAAIEPVQLLALEIARRALADAGYASSVAGDKDSGGRAFDRERTAVIFGAEAGTDLSSAYSFRALFPHYVGPLPSGLEESLPTLSEDSFPGVLSNVIAGRIANRLDLGGVNYTVDAACAASLAAIDMAAKELVSGSSDMVLCGGADLHNSINDYLMFASVHALSSSGQCHTFDADADGIVLGEGVACVVLKRLADAERDGDRIYAVLKGCAGASDGKSLGLTAPRQDGQVRALDRAYRQAGVSPADVGLVEAHGTGTIVGDRTELATLNQVFTKAGAEIGTCVLGSVKSQIGHTKCAAGMAGLIKATLAIHHGVLPPTLNIKKPNPAWDPAVSPFVFLDQAQPWSTPAGEARVAAVSAFGFGGTNFHAILASHEKREQSHATTAWSAELFAFRGADRAVAIAAVTRVEKLLARPDAIRFRDLARSVCAAGSGPIQIAIVADDLNDLRAKLVLAREERPDRRGVFVSEGAVGGKVAFLCPGQGSQKTGMLGELFIAFPRLHRWLELGSRWTPKIFPRSAFTREEKTAQTAALTDTRVAQPALGVVDLAMAELLASLGVRPELIGGHSYGELAALCIAGAIGERDLLALSEARGECILEAARLLGDDAGTMAAVAADAAVVAPLIAGCDGVVIANHNSRSQCVLSGATTAMEMALVLVSGAGLTARRIPVACAFHSPLVASARETLAKKLAAIAIESPRIPVWSNVTAEAYEPARIRELLAEQVASPVRFVEQIESMYAAGARIFVESGPGQVLTKLVGEILGDRPHTAVACDVGDGGVRQLLRAIAALAVAGVPVDPNALYWDRDALLVDLDPDRPVKRGAATWLVNGHTTRPSGGAAPAPRVVPNSIVSAGPSAQGQQAPAAASYGAPIAAAGERDGIVIEYLRNMRSLIGAQRDVMMAYLGSTPAPMMEPVSRVIDVVDARPATAPAPVVGTPAVIDPMQLVLSIVSERTGYPIETLGVDLDLEADLSIDSIKRIEIIGELAQRLGLKVDNNGGDAVIEELATRKTLRALVAWLTDKLAAGASKAEPKAEPIVTTLTLRPEPVAEEVTMPMKALGGGDSVSRFRLAIIPAPAPLNGHSTFAGQRFTIHAGHGASELAAGLAARLEAEGATVTHGSEAVARSGLPDRAASPNGDAQSIDGYVELAPVDSVGAMREQFERVRAAVIGGAKWILVATLAGELGRGAGSLGGPAGLLRTLAAEYPNVRARVVHLEPGDRSAAARLHGELHAHDTHVEIGYPASTGVRSTYEVIPAPLANTGAAKLALDAQSIVVITGGARGITAKIALALVRRYECRVELVGRSPLPGDEDPAFADAKDATALRRLLSARGTPTGAIESASAAILAAREIRATIAALGARARYHAIDVRTPAFGELIDALYVEHGRIDAVIHGAGVLEDKLLRDKTPESFDRVYGTKVIAAQTLVERLRGDIKLVMWFSSISGVFGNRGQGDYAAAGDALDKLAWSLQKKIAGRVVSVDWGPWSGTGMVSPALAREYARRGIALVDPERGAEALLAEIRGGSRDDAQVILTASDPRALLKRAAPHASAVEHESPDA